MYKGKTILGIIPARGGSKGLYKKNLRLLSGKPLIVWAIEGAKKSRYLDRLILSSEDREIAAIAKENACEVPFLRPIELAQDDTPGIDPILHAIENLSEKYDYVVMLQPTSPLRRNDDIDNCIELCIKQKYCACVSVTKPDKTPYWMYSLDENGRMLPLIPMEKPIIRRQDLPEVYSLNGAIYVAQTAWLLSNKTFLTHETHAYIMPEERSVDIDSDIDFRFAEFLMKR